LSNVPLQVGRPWIRWRNLGIQTTSSRDKRSGYSKTTETPDIIADRHPFYDLRRSKRSFSVGISTRRRHRCTQLASNIANNCNRYHQDDGTLVGPLIRRSLRRGGISTTARSSGIHILWCSNRRTHLRVCSCTLVDTPTQPTADTQYLHRTNDRDMAGTFEETPPRTQNIRHRCSTRTCRSCHRLLRHQHRRFDLGTGLATHEPHHDFCKQTGVVSTIELYTKCHNN